MKRQRPEWMDEFEENVKRMSSEEIEELISKYNYGPTVDEYIADVCYNIIIKHWLLCINDFKIFKAGEQYWLTKCDNGMYCVRSDNSLGQYVYMTYRELLDNFDKTDRLV